MNRLKLGRPHTVVLGIRGAYVVLYDDSTLSHNLQGLYPALQAVMDSMEEQSKRNSITFVALNPYVAGHYFVAVGDGTAQWNLPHEMHTDVKSVVETLRPLPADTPAQPDTATSKFQLAAHTGMVMNNMF
jgi:hypothetical protein